MNTIFCKWGTTDFQYGKTPYVWSQACVSVVTQALRHSGGPEPEKNLGQWLEKNPQKKKQLIEILCIIDGQKYKESHTVSDGNLTVKDIHFLAKHVLGMEIMVSLNKESLILEKING